MKAIKINDEIYEFLMKRQHILYEKKGYKIPLSFIASKIIREWKDE